MVRKNNSSALARGGSPMGEEIQRTSITFKDSLADSKKFRRSQRLQSILGRMRNSQDEEFALPTTKKVSVTESTTVEEERQGDSAEKRGEDDAIDGDDICGHNETDREDQIREQISIAIMDQMNETPTVLSPKSTSIFNDNDQVFIARNAPSPVLMVQDPVDAMTANVLPQQKPRSPSSPQKRKGSRTCSKSPRKVRHDAEWTSGSDSSDTEAMGATKTQSLRITKKPQKDALPLGAKNDKVPSTKQRDRKIIKSKSSSSDDFDDESTISLESVDSSDSEFGSAPSISSGYSSTSTQKKRMLREIKARQKVQPQKKKQVLDDPPLVAQAGNFVTKIVEHLKFYETFGLPDRVKDHAKSQPIIAAEAFDGNTATNINQNVTTNDETNSIIGDSSAPISTGANRKVTSFKLVTVGRKELMEELRSEISKRPPPKQISKKLISEVMEGIDGEIEAIPQVVAVEIESTRSADLAQQSKKKCGFSSCSDALLPFWTGETEKREEKYRGDWTPEEFLTLNEALIALEASEDWDAVTTLALIDGPTLGAATKQDLASITAIPRNARHAQSNISSNATGGAGAEAEAEAVILAVSSDSEERKERPDLKANEEDGISLVYSLNTEDGIIAKHQNGIAARMLTISDSDDSSMVPLKHGLRGSIKRLSTELKVAAADSLAKEFNVNEKEPDTIEPLEPVEKEIHTMRMSESRNSPFEELALALSLSGESNNLIPQSPQFNHQEITCTNTNTVIATTKAPSKPKTNTSVLFHKAQSAEGHQVELFAKIQEFQRRRSQKLANTNDSSDYLETLSKTSDSPPPSQIKQLPPPTIVLPKASKQIAQAYVDALTKKVSAAQSTQPVANALMTGDSNGKALFDSMTMTTTMTDAQDVSVAGHKSEEAHNQKRWIQSPINSQPNKPNQLSTLNPSKASSDMSTSSRSLERQRVLEHLSEVCQASLDQDTLVSESTGPETSVDVDDLVSRIDTVVQRLVMTGKLKERTHLSQQSELEQRTLKNNTTELLQNLAILRARRASGPSTCGTRNVPSSVPSSVSPDGTSSIPTNRLTRPSNTPRIESMPPTQELLINKNMISEPEKRHFSFGGSNLVQLRARRDQAAMEVRDISQRLSGWSGESGESPLPKRTTLTESTTRAVNGTLAQDSGMGIIRRSISSARLSGPPKPESFSKERPQRTAQKENKTLPRLTNTIYLPSSEMMTTEAGSSGTISELQQTNMGAIRALVSTTTPEMSVVDLTAWEEDDLQALPLLLESNLSGTNKVLETVAKGSYESDADEGSYNDETENADDEETFDDDDDDDDDDYMNGEDDTATYGSDNDSERLGRIESMIQELRARRQRTLVR